MKLKASKPTCVFQGDVMEKLHWGFVQFPWLYATDDDSIVLSVHCEDDAPHLVGEGEDFAKNKRYFKTLDNGKTWQRADVSDIRRMGYRTPNGDMIMLKPFPAKNIFGVEVPTNFGNYRNMVVCGRS